MNTELKDLIQVARDSLRKAGQTADYVENLNHTWNAFLNYHAQNPCELTQDYANRFLSEYYGIPPGVKISSLRPIHRRRKRAIKVLLNCKENQSPFVSHSYWECRFIEPFTDAFSAFLDARKSGNFSLPTINRDIYGLNRFSEYLLLSKADSFGDINGELVVGFIKWLSQKTGLSTIKGAASTLRLLFKFLNNEGYTTRDFSTTVPKVRVHKDVPSTYTPCEISLASSMLRNNVPLPVISETLSHSSTETTRIYLKVDTENLRRLALDVPPLKGPLTYSSSRVTAYLKELRSQRSQRSSPTDSARSSPTRGDATTPSKGSLVYGSLRFTLFH